MQSNDKGKKIITRGFLLAGLYNLFGVLFFSQIFTDDTLSKTDPVVFSWVGQLGIILWGLAYLSVSRSFWKVPHLIAVFCVEKMLYAIAWAVWLVGNQDALTALSNTSTIMWLFFSSYGWPFVVLCGT